MTERLELLEARLMHQGAEEFECRRQVGKMLPRRPVNRHLG